MPFAMPLALPPLRLHVSLMPADISPFVDINMRYRYEGVYAAAFDFDACYDTRRRRLY